MIITGGKYKGRKITAPDEKISRPTLSKVRMGVFNTLFSILGEFEGKSFLDMFGGSGIMGLEALSRGFKEAVTFEKNPKAVSIIRKNYETLGLRPNIKAGDSLKLIKTVDHFFDVIYIDPPYQSGFYENVIKSVSDCSIIIAEHSTPFDFDIPGKISVIKTKNYGGKMLTFFQNNTK